jgi:phosphoribosylformylglycinamidine synthase
MGVPTVGGECTFHPAYNGNILVNAMTVGLARADRIFYSAAAGVGNAVVYLGSKTGRDGIHGATMASASFDESSEEKRPTVQVGDPFTEKLLLEACLELMATDAIVAIQDMGAAGLTSSSVEMTSKGGLGIELELDRVPTREAGMTPYEIMLSESQERMLMILKPGCEELARRVFEKWELDFAVIGHLTDSGRLQLKFGNNLVADLPLQPLVEAAPVYQRPTAPTPQRAAVRDVPPVKLADALLQMIGCPDLASKRWIWEQYDHLVMGETLQIPGGDAAVVRVPGRNKALALTTDCTPRYCQADPRSGGAQAVAEAWRNLTAVGARPLAITDCMNFGNPERPEIMGQFADCIRGMAAACAALDFPVVSGNVSLYNETGDQGVLPTPSIGGVGVLDDPKRMATLAFKQAGDAILLVGETRGHVGSSLFLREIAGREDGAPPPVDLAAERRNGDFVRRVIGDGLVSAVHDVSDGGLLVAVAEMAMAGNIGATLALPSADPAFCFGEDQGRYVLTAAGDAAVATIERLAREASVPICRLGTTGGAALTLGASGTILVSALRARNEAWLPDYMAATA